MFQDILFTGTKPYGIVIHFDRQTGQTHSYKVWDVPEVRREEKRLRKIIDGMIIRGPITERPKPSLVWANEIAKNMGAGPGEQFEVASDSPHARTIAFDFTKQMMLHSAGMGLLKYLGYRCVLIVDEPIGYRYIRLPGTADESLERLERDEADRARPGQDHGQGLSRRR